MRIFKPTYKTNGSTRTSPRWHVSFQDHRGIRRRVVAFSDKAASAELGRKLEILVAVCATNQLPDPEMARWLEGLLPYLRQKFAEFGLLDDRVLSLANPLTEHVADYHAALLARGNTAAYAKLRKSRLLRAFAGCGFACWRDIKASRVEEWLARQRAAAQMTTCTTNHFVTSLRGFCSWVVIEGRAAGSPLERLKGVAVTDEQERGVFTVEKVRRLIEKTAESNKVRSRMDGPTRALLYHLAVETGLRAGSIGSLTRDSFRFSEDGSGVVTVLAGRQKNRRKHRVPIRPSLAAQVRPLMARTPAGRALFNLRRGAGAGLLRDDMRDAGLPEYDSEGHKLVFHSFRHTAATWLCEHSVDLKVVQEILGHRTFAMTADRYTHARLEHVAAEMAKMPELLATGTDASACATLARRVSAYGHSCPTMAIDTPRDDTENAFLTRRAGRVAERAGVRNRLGHLRRGARSGRD